MKRIIFFLLMLSASFLYAEKGYNGINWGDSVVKVKAKKNITCILSDDESAVYKATARILDKSNEIYFTFRYDSLQFIYYSIDYNEENLNILISKFKNLTLQAQTESLINSEVYNTYTPKENEEVSLDMAIAAFPYFYENGEELETFIPIFETKEKSAPAKIYIAQYNEDSKVYIMSNLIENKIIVTYLKAQQDF